MIFLKPMRQWFSGASRAVTVFGRSKSLAWKDLARRRGRLSRCHFLKARSGTFAHLRLLGSLANCDLHSMTVDFVAQLCYVLARATTTAVASPGGSSKPGARAKAGLSELVVRHSPDMAANQGGHSKCRGHCGPFWTSLLHRSGRCFQHRPCSAGRPTNMYVSKFKL